jgi:hypothetical protein
VQVTLVAGTRYQINQSQRRSQSLRRFALCLSGHLDLSSNPIACAAVIGWKNSAIQSEQQARAIHAESGLLALLS